MKMKILFALFGSLIFSIAPPFHSQPPITILPITINPKTNTTLMAVVIEGKQYHLEFDSGAVLQLALQKEIIDTIKKKRLWVYTSRWM